MSARTLQLMTELREDGRFTSDLDNVIVLEGSGGLPDSKEAFKSFVFVSDHQLPEANLSDWVRANQGEKTRVAFVRATVLP